MWLAPPPPDEAGAAVSAAIDSALARSRVLALREGVRTLLSTGEGDAEFRDRLWRCLGGGGRVALEAGVHAEVSCVGLGRGSAARGGLRKVLAAFEPALLVWGVDPLGGTGTDTGSGDVRRALERALGDFLLAARGLRMEQGSGVIVVVNRAREVALAVQGNVDAFRDVLPTLSVTSPLPSPTTVLRAIEAEFAAATRASGSRPFSFSCVFVGGKDDDETRELVVKEMARVRQQLEDAVEPPQPPPQQQQAITANVPGQTWTTTPTTPTTPTPTTTTVVLLAAVVAAFAVLTMMAWRDGRTKHAEPP